MTTHDTGRPGAFERPGRIRGNVDFTLMYVAHDAFLRDLDALVAAARAGRAGEPAVRAGWDMFQTQLVVHHRSEDASIWPMLRAEVTLPEHTAVLDAMEREHSAIDPLLVRIQDALAAPGPRLLDLAVELRDSLAAHLEHEERQALPLVEQYVGARGWAAFAKEIRKEQGVRGGSVFIPWMLHGLPEPTKKRVLATLPPPVRLGYRLAFRPRFERTPRWIGA